jgi:hypothetical protein
MEKYRTNPATMRSQYARYTARIKRSLERMRLFLNCALALSVALLAGCNGGTVDQHALQRDAENVGSLASEGRLLAHDVTRGASTGIFVRVHAKELSVAAANLEDALGERPTSPGITADVRKLSRLAGRVSAELERLHLHPTDRRVAASLERPFARAADAADELAK